MSTDPEDLIQRLQENISRVVLGKEEVVIKSLGGGLKNLKGIAGGAILGDGRVGLILDMSGIYDVANGNGRRVH